MTDTYNWNPFVCNMQMSQFIRDGNGRPDYSRGLRQLSVEMLVFLSGQEFDDVTRDRIGNEVLVQIEYHENRFKGTVLCDNNDAFFLNMIPPHSNAMLAMLFTKAKMHYTPDIAPPVSRLNFPFLVGSNEADLRSDALDFFQNYFSTLFVNQKFKVDDKDYFPFSGVEVNMHSYKVDDSYNF